MDPTAYCVTHDEAALDSGSDACSSDGSPRRAHSYRGCLRRPWFLLRAPSIFAATAAGSVLVWFTSVLSGDEVFGGGADPMTVGTLDSHNALIGDVPNGASGTATAELKDLLLLDGNSTDRERITQQFIAAFGQNGFREGAIELSDGSDLALQTARSLPLPPNRSRETVLAYESNATGALPAKPAWSATASMLGKLNLTQIFGSRFGTLISFAGRRPNKTQGSWDVQPSMNASNLLLRRGAEQLRKTGARLRFQSEAHLRQKRVELSRKGAQVHNASLALVGAISTGQVQQYVVWGVVMSFIACAVALQCLSASRGELRQLVRFVVRRLLQAEAAPNELVTRPYAGWTELALRVGLDFLNEPANLMLLSIGSLQVLATWSKADPWRCKKVNLLVLLLNFAYTVIQEVHAQWLAACHDGAWNLATVMRVGGVGAWQPVLAKDVDIGDLIRLQYGDVCPATGQLIATSHSYVLWNSLCETGEDCCSILSVGDSVLLGFVLAMEEAEVYIRITETRTNNGGRVSPSGRIVGSGSDSSLMSRRTRRMERFPEHMNRPLMRANLGALAFLFCASALVCALNYNASGSPGNQSVWHLSQPERLLMTHFFSAVVQLNTIIPSMRWVVLFFLYVFLVEAARPHVFVQNWRAFHGLEHRRVLYSDKTGTLTEVGMRVARLRLADSGEDVRRDLTVIPTMAAFKGLGWQATVLMACNDCQPRAPGGGRGSLVGRRPGTSPEEMAIAEHLEDALGITIVSNPLRPRSAGPPASIAVSAGMGEAAIATHDRPLALIDTASGRELVRATLLARSDFDAAMGGREALIALSLDGRDEQWVVRQGGADVVAELAGVGAREAAIAAEDRDRALGWCVKSVGSDGSGIGAWRYVLRASFANPPRSTSAPLVAHCRSIGVSVRVLTGDACVAALHIAREIGLWPAVTAANAGTHGCACVVYSPGEAPGAFAARVQSTVACSSGSVSCVAVPGAIVRKQIEAGDGTDAWLTNERLCAVIYRTRAADKALIVGRTEEFGRSQRRAADAAATVRPLCSGRRLEDRGVCAMMGDAANDAEAISLEDVVGISLRHGAAPCRLNADFVVDCPGDLVAVRTELFGRAHAGASWLLEDVCFLCGLVSALTLCGVWIGGFVFLPRGFLYDDPFDARLMMLFSSGLYAPSACAAACRIGASPAALPPTDNAAKPRTLLAGPRDGIRALLIGGVLGITLGLVGPSDNPGRCGRWILSATATSCLLKHGTASLKCLAPQPDAVAGRMVRAALPAPWSRVAAVLDLLGKPLVRIATLGIYLLLVWL